MSPGSWIHKAADYIPLSVSYSHTKTIKLILLGEIDAKLLRFRQCSGTG